MMKRFQSLFFLLSSSLAILGAPARYAVETQNFPAAPGDTVIIQNDYGRVQILAWDKPSVEARIRRISSDEQQLEKVGVVCRKNEDKIHIHAYFRPDGAESVYLEIRVPTYLNVVVWGAKPAVELSRIEGYVRVSTLTGLITAEDLTSSVSLLTESGDIVYRSRIQPSSDVRLESVHGDIQCYLKENLNLRGWARAGAELSWNEEVEINNGQLDKQVGVGGPLFWAGSLHGNVRFHFVKAMEIRTADSTTAPREVPLVTRPDSGTPPQETSTSTPPPGSPVGSHTVNRPTSAALGTMDTGYSLKVDVDWIHLNVSVRNRYTNRSEPNLQKEDFLVYEDGVLQTVEKFESIEAPFNLLLLLDVSGSTGSFIDLIKEASINFTREIKPNDRMAVATFNSQVRLIQDFTSNRAEVVRALKRIGSHGGTAFYDALDTCIRDYMHNMKGRKAIVIFTDGVDNQLTGHLSRGSRTTFPQLYREIQEIESLIYTIFLDTEADITYRPGRHSTGGVVGILEDIIRGRTPPYNSRRSRGHNRAAYVEAREQLRLIADQTGGHMYSPRRVEDLSSVYAEIADDLRVQYTLAYNPTNPDKDGRWCRINVKLHHKADLVARTRKGYYAGKAQELS